MARVRPGHMYIFRQYDAAVIQGLCSLIMRLNYAVPQDQFPKLIFCMLSSWYKSGRPFLPHRQLQLS